MKTPTNFTFKTVKEESKKRPLGVFAGQSSNQCQSSGGGNGQSGKR